MMMCPEYNIICLRYINTSPTRSLIQLLLFFYLHYGVPCGANGSDKTEVFLFFQI